MDFHEMNRKNLQNLCKKHGIPANLKNIEMADRLASLFLQKEDEETVTESKDSVEEEEENLVGSRKAKKVRFSAETDNQVFEFTRSVKKNVRRTRKAPLPRGGIDLRRSKRSVSKKGIGSNGDASNSMSGVVEGPSNSVKVTRRIGSVGSVQEEGEDRDLIAPEQFGDREIEDRRRSTRLTGKIEASKPVDLLPAAKRSKQGKDTDLNAPERVEGKDIEEGRRSRRLAAKTVKSFEEGGTTLLPAAKRSKGLADVANKEDEKVTGEQHRKDGDSKVEMVRRRSMRFVNEQTNAQDSKVEMVRRRSMRFVNEQTNAQDQRSSVRVKASVASPLMGQAMSKLKNETVKAGRVVLVDKNTDENLVRSSKRVTRNMKRERSAETGVDSGTASNQSNLTPKKTLDESARFEQEKACGADVEAGGSSKKSKTMNQECIKDKPQGIVIIEDSPSSSKTKAAEFGMILEKVVDPTLDKSDDNSQMSNTPEMTCEPMEGECEEKLERDSVEDKEEVSTRSLLLIECLSPDSVPLAVISSKANLSVPTGHILPKDIASTVIAEESTNTKDELLIYAPESELEEHRSIAKLANVEELLENSTECWNEIHSSKDDEKGSFEKDVQAEILHGNVSECNTENNSAGEEMEISKIGVMSVAHCVNLTPEKLLGEYAQLEPEEAERPNVEDRSSAQKMEKAVSQELVKDMPQEMAEGSPSISEVKATEPVVISESVLDSTQKHEQATVLLAAAKNDKGEASSLSEFLTEGSEVKTCLDNRSTGCSLSVETTLSPASVQLAMSNPEGDLGVPTGNDIVLTVITEEDKITKKETLIVTPTSELKGNSSVAELAKVEAILVNSAECCKEDEKGSLEKDVQAENLHVNFSEGNTEKSSSEEAMEINKDSCMSANLTAEQLLDTYTQLVPEEAWGPNMEFRSSSKKMNTLSSEFLKENPQGMAEDSPSTSVTKTAETIMMSENVSVDISPVGNTQELNPQLTDEEREEKQEVDILLVVETEKEKKKASSPSEFLIERPEVSIPESELFVETTPPPPSSVQIAVSNPESELSVPTGHILVKDIVSAVIAEEDIKTVEVPKSVHSFVAKLAETDAVLENSAECWNESLSSKDDDRGSLEKEKQSAKQRGNFFEHNAENISAEEQADICKVGRISDGHCVAQETLDEFMDESLRKSVQTISSARGSLSTDFASLSSKEENVSECLQEEEVKALSQPTPTIKVASNALDRSSLFTTPERNLMSMEQLSESGMTPAAYIVTQHNDGTVESHSVVFTTPEQVLLLSDSGLNEVGKEEKQTATCFPGESDVLNTCQNEAFKEGERIVVELHDESDIAASPLRQSSVGDFKEDRHERNEENRTVELHCESGTCSGPDKHAALVNSASHGAENSGGNKAVELYEESFAFTGLEERHGLFGDSGKDKAREDEVKMDPQFYEEARLSTEMHKDLPLADPELGEEGWLGIKNADESGRLEGQLLYGDSEQKKAVKPAEKAAAEFHDVSAVPNIPEESELEEATKSEENNVLELQADCDNFADVNITAKSHDISDVLTASESHSLMGDFEPDGEENKDVELLSESNISTDVERHLLSEESFVFISPERRQHLGNSEPHTAGKQERKEVEFKDEYAFFTRLETRLLLGESGQNLLENGSLGSAQCQSHRASSPKVISKDDSVVLESQVAAPDFRENTIADFSGSIASKVSYSHGFSAGEETAGAEFMPKASQAENDVGLDATQSTSNQSRGNSLHVDSVNHFDFDTKGTTDTIMDAYVLALPAEGNSQTTGEISNHIEVAGTCSLVSEESVPSTYIQNQIHDAVEELEVTDELIEAKLTKYTQSDSKTIDLPVEGDSKSISENSSQLEVTGTCSMVSEKSSPFMDIHNHINDALGEELAVTDDNKADEVIEAEVTKKVDSSGGSDVLGRASVLAGTEDEQLCYNSEVTDPVDTAFEKDISLAPDESTLEKNNNAEDDEMVNGEATPSPEETLVKPSDNIGEPGTSSEKQIRKEPVLLYGTQAKPKRHEMKENAPNSKVVDNLNVTAPRTSKRQPLQDLRKN
ncbi:uncharacterized protein LOC108817506 isoform X3 [Raphanus sativus]|uniref:Uncharacterized protein LOC108817506 isoform X3 n=1 Tax=Raphanus sativus TaxID=3726 RepID=A0A9W3C6S5_RAPSA|nr:uncharacterized protein LOC108817506 isoform X3 [Raphanus sativus]